jgi:hypothetical protein
MKERLKHQEAHMRAAAHALRDVCELMERAAELLAEDELADEPDMLRRAATALQMLTRLQGEVADRAGEMAGRLVALELKQCSVEPAAVKSRRSLRLVTPQPDSAAQG